MRRLVGKAAYVVKQPGDGKHHCHWPGCEKLVPPAMWGCKPHWAKIPQHLQRAIWQAYIPSQERSKTPSQQYVEAARAVQIWIADYVDKQPKVPAQITMWIDEASDIPDHVIRELAGGD